MYGRAYSRRLDRHPEIAALGVARISGSRVIRRARARGLMRGGSDRTGTGRSHFGLSCGDPQRERGRDRDPERVARGCDCPQEDERGGAETGRRSVTSAGDRATAVTGVRRRTFNLSKLLVIEDSSAL